MKFDWGDNAPVSYLSVVDGDLEEFKKDIAGVLGKYGIESYQYSIKFGGNKAFVAPVGAEGSPQLVTGIEMFVHPKVDSSEFTDLEVVADS